MSARNGESAETTVEQLLAIEQRENEQLRRLLELRRENSRLRARLGTEAEQKDFLSRIACACCAEFHLDISALSSPSRHYDLAWPRQVIFWLARELTSLSSQQIGNTFSRHHATVLYATKAVRRRMETEAPERLRLERLRETAKSLMAKS